MAHQCISADYSVSYLHSVLCGPLVHFYLYSLDLNDITHRVAFCPCKCALVMILAFSASVIFPYFTNRTTIKVPNLPIYLINIQGEHQLLLLCWLCTKLTSFCLHTSQITTDSPTPKNYLIIFFMQLLLSSEVHKFYKAWLEN